MAETNEQEKKTVKAKYVQNGKDFLHAAKAFSNAARNLLPDNDRSKQIFRKLDREVGPFYNANSPKKGVQDIDFVPLYRNALELRNLIEGTRNDFKGTDEKAKNDFLEQCRALDEAIGKLLEDPIDYTFDQKTNDRLPLGKGVVKEHLEFDSMEGATEKRSDFYAPIEKVMYGNVYYDRKRKAADEGNPALRDQIENLSDDLAAFRRFFAEDKKGENPQLSELSKLAIKKIIVDSLAFDKVFNHPDEAAERAINGKTKADQEYLNNRVREESKKILKNQDYALNNFVNDTVELGKQKVFVEIFTDPVGFASKQYLPWKEMNYGIDEPTEEKTEIRTESAPEVKQESAVEEPIREEPGNAEPEENEAEDSDINIGQEEPKNIPKVDVYSQIMANIPKGQAWKSDPPDPDEFKEMLRLIDECDPMYVRSSKDFRSVKSNIKDIIKLTKNGVNNDNAEALNEKIRDAYDYALLYVKNKENEPNRSDLAEERLMTMRHVTEMLASQYARSNDQCEKQDTLNRDMAHNYIVDAQCDLEDGDITPDERQSALAKIVYANYIAKEDVADSHYNRIEAERVIKNVKDKIKAKSAPLSKQGGEKTKTESLKTKKNDGPDMDLR